MHQPGAHGRFWWRGADAHAGPAVRPEELHDDEVDRGSAAVAETHPAPAPRPFRSPGQVVAAPAVVHPEPQPFVSADAPAEPVREPMRESMGEPGREPGRETGRDALSIATLPLPELASGLDPVTPEVEIRPVFSPEDLGEAFTTEIREREERLRAQLEKGG